MNNCQRGFTVIELVVALAISALILTAVYSSFNSAEQARSRITEGNAAYHVGRVISSRISRELRSVQFRTGMPESRFRNRLQSGMESFEFSSSASTPLAAQPGLPSTSHGHAGAAMADPIPLRYAIGTGETGRSLQCSLCGQSRSHPFIMFVKLAGFRAQPLHHTQDGIIQAQDRHIQQ